MKEPPNEAEGSRIEGAGPGYLVFHPDGTVLTMRRGSESLGERKAITKNFSQEVTVAIGAECYTLTIDDFVRQGQRFGSELAKMFAMVISRADETQCKRFLKDLTSVATAARRLRQDRFTTIHGKFPGRLALLAARLGKVPTKNEIGRFLFPGKSYSKDLARQVSELCESNGYGWLPTDPPGRPKKAA